MSGSRRAAAGRPKAESSTVAILDATLEALAERGYHDTTLDEIIARARSSKPTVYRRWPSKAGLVAAAVRHGLEKANPTVPDTGDVAADLQRLLQGTVRALSRTPLGGAIRSLIAEAERNPDLDDCLATVGRERRAVLETVLTRIFGHERESDLATDLALGAIYFRYFVRRVPLSTDLAPRIAEVLLSLAEQTGLAERRASQRLDTP